MKETQKKYNDLQDRWIAMLYEVYFPLRLKCSMEELCIKTKEAWNDVADALEPLVFGFKDFFEALSKVNEDIQKIDPPRINIKHPQYPQFNVDNIKINTKGFTLPPVRCARSRCK